MTHHREPAAASHWSHTKVARLKRISGFAEKKQEALLFVPMLRTKTLPQQAALQVLIPPLALISVTCSHTWDHALTLGPAGSEDKAITAHKGMYCPENVLHMPLGDASPWCMLLQLIGALVTGFFWSKASALTFQISGWLMYLEKTNAAAFYPCNSILLYFIFGNCYAQNGNRTHPQPHALPPDF